MTQGLAPALLALALAASAALAEEQKVRSGLDFATPGLRQMQEDDVANPGMLWVAEGEQSWTEAAGSAGKSCADCHGAIGAMAKAGFPRRDPRDPGKLINLELQVERCRTERMGAPPLGYESQALLALTTAIRHQARGRLAVVAYDAEAIAEGEREYRRRRGQLDLACSQCHVERAGKRLRDETLSQGQSNGFPAYRVRWQSVGSLHRRFQACNNAVGAEPSELGAQDYIQLEWYLAWRGRDLPVETPAVRQ